jgi:hypothetical protein
MSMRIVLVVTRGFQKWISGLVPMNRWCRWRVAHQDHVAIHDRIASLIQSGQQARTSILREHLFLGSVFIAVLLQTYVLLRPGKTFFGQYPLAIPPAFGATLPMRRYALPLLLLVGALVLVSAARRFPELLKHPRRTIPAIFVLGIALHVALICSISGGLEAFHERALKAGHGEFLVSAVTIPDLRGTLQNYESYVVSPRRPFAASKGPGVIVFFRGLNVVANSVVMRPLLEVLASSDSSVQSWITLRGDQLDATQLEQLRYLLALIFVLFPLLTYLPVFLLFWVGRLFADDIVGTLAAILYLFVPAISLNVAHLDFALYPFVVCVCLGWFMFGMAQRRLAYIAGSAAIFTLYFYMTLAAISLVAFLGAYIGLVLLARLRRGEALRGVALDVVQTVAVFALVCSVLLACLYAWMHFHPIERYTMARNIQRDWVTTEYNVFWVTANLLGYFLSFGLAQTSVVLVQQWRSIHRVFTGGADSIDFIAISWLCMLLGLVGLAHHHGETNRLWTFLSPFGCLLVARSFRDLIPLERLGPPLLLLFGSLILARYRLSYF